MKTGTLTSFIFIAAVAAGLLNDSLIAQETWDLKQCIQYGLEHHKTNEISKGNVEKARQMTLENVALYLPQVRADLRFEDYFKLPTQIAQIESVIPGLVGPTDLEIESGKQFTAFGTIEAEQALYNRLLLVSLRGLKPNMAIANLNLQQNQETLIYTISNAYIQAHVLKQQIALLGENESKFSKQLEILQLQVEKGVAKKMDASRIAVALNNVTSQLDVAKSGYEVAVNRLKNTIGMELTDSLVLNDSTEIATINLLADDAGFDMDSKTEIQLQKNQLKLLHVQKQRVGAGYFPTLSFFARYSAQSFSNEFSGAFTEWYDFSSIGLKLSLPIFDGMQKSAQRKQQIINMRNAQLNLEMSQQAFQLQHQNATSQLQRARSNLKNNETNVALAKEIFDAMAVMHQQGVISLSEFLNAETAYKESQLNYITALLNYYTAVVELEKAKGTLTQFYQKL